MQPPGFSIGVSPLFYWSLHIILYIGLKKNKMKEIEYTSGSVQLIDRLKELWHELNEHHIRISTHFSADFKKFTFDARMSSLKKKSEEGDLFIDIAVYTKSNEDIGYCISSVNSDNQGEIDSIYIKPEFRNLGIASELMNRAISWLDSNNVDEKNIGVVAGNERTYKFYSKFGFLPRIILLRQKSS